MMRQISLGLVLTLAISGVYAANYKWTDEKGHTHYGQTPPPGVKAEQIKTKKSSSSAQQEIDQFKAKQEAQVKQKKVAAEKEAKRAQLLEQKQIWRANCNAAKQKLASLEEKPKVRKRDFYGNLSVMPEDELKKRIANASKEVDLYCNPPQPEQPQVTEQQ